MKLLLYLSIMLGGAIFSLMAWFGILYYIDPFQAGWLELTLFYLSLGLSLTGFFVLFLFIVRQGLSHEPLYRHLDHSFRQGLLLSLAIILILVLQSYRQLTLVTLMVTLIVLLGLEGFVFGRR